MATYGWYVSIFHDLIATKVYHCQQFPMTAICLLAKLAKTGIVAFPLSKLFTFLTSYNGLLASVHVFLLGRNLQPMAF